MAENTVILDNGAHWAKVGLKTDKAPRLVYNCVMKVKCERRRAYIGNQIDDCPDASGLFYMLPFQKVTTQYVKAAMLMQGYVMHWDIEKTVWDYLFSSECCNLDLTKHSVILTEPYFNFRPIREIMTEIFFEDYEVPYLLRANPGTLSSWKYRKENKCNGCCVVVDCGYSFTHVIPYVKGDKVNHAVKRIDIGGKLLTNYLKEVISYRHLNMMDETFVVNQAKEDACFVSTDFKRDMEMARLKGPKNTIMREYILPDFTNITRGYVRKVTEEDINPDLQRIPLNVERFAVPELIFNPSDVGIRQMGLAQLIQHCIGLCPEPARPYLYDNIVLTGGCCRFPGFRDRLQMDVRSLASDDYDVNVHLPNDPVTYAWEGGVALANDPSYQALRVSKADYEEKGLHAVDKILDL